MMETISSVTISQGHNLVVGDKIEIQTLDTRWWVRLWHGLLLKPAPTIVEKFTIQEVASSTMFQIDPHHFEKEELLATLSRFRNLRNAEPDLDMKMRYNSVIDNLDTLISKLYERHGCGECDCDFPCYKGNAPCIRKG